MNITKYEVIEKIAETGSISRTAEYFQYTQSAVSQTVKNLEKEFGINLFRRTNSGFLLTHEGAKVMECIREINAGHRKLRECVGSFQNLLDGDIRLGSYISIASHILPDLIKKFNELYPHIRFDLYQEADVMLTEKLQENYLDAVFYCNPHKRDLQYQKIWRDPFVVALPENHFLSNRDSIDLKELADESFIELQVGFGVYYQKMFSEAGFSPKIKFRMTEELSILAMVEKGHGVAVLPWLTTFRNPYKVKTILIEPCYYRELGLVTSKNTHLSWAVKQFISFVAEYAKELFDIFPEEIREIMQS